MFKSHIVFWIQSLSDLQIKKFTEIILTVAKPDLSDLAKVNFYLPRRKKNIRIGKYSLLQNLP